ncbi:MAG: hypothetical protein KAQ87_02200 [Candidatus Pacebacteria bacterium]|nr:hypothetical protein [Candidatus Paceibacterota bacterium]
MSKNKFQKKAGLSIISFFSLLIITSVFSVSVTMAACNDGTLDPGEGCDTDGAGVKIYLGGATTCADLGDTVSGNPLDCNADCTIDDSLCGGGFNIDPLDAPANVPADFDDAVINLTNWVLGFVAMIAVLAIVFGGVMYIGSAGDETKATTGKRVVTYALIGLVIAGIAYALVNVIVSIIL